MGWQHHDCRSWCLSARPSQIRSALRGCCVYDWEQHKDGIRHIKAVSGHSHYALWFCDLGGFDDKKAAYPVGPHCRSVY